MRTEWGGDLTARLQTNNIMDFCIITAMIYIVIGMSGAAQALYCGSSHGCCMEVTSPSQALSYMLMVESFFNGCGSLVAPSITGEPCHWCLIWSVTCQIQLTTYVNMSIPCSCSGFYWMFIMDPWSSITKIYIGSQTNGDVKPHLTL